jgi:hypothetical protein
LRAGVARVGAGAGAALSVVAGTEVATFPGGGEPSAVKSAFCCESVAGWGAGVGLRRFMVGSFGKDITRA